MSENNKNNNKNNNTNNTNTNNNNNNNNNNNTNNTNTNNNNNNNLLNPPFSRKQPVSYLSNDDLKLNTIGDEKIFIENIYLFFGRKPDYQKYDLYRKLKNKNHIIYTVYEAGKDELIEEFEPADFLRGGKVKGLFSNVQFEQANKDSEFNEKGSSNTASSIKNNSKHKLTRRQKKRNKTYRRRRHYRRG